VRRTNSLAISAGQLSEKTPWDEAERSGETALYPNKSAVFSAFLKGFGLM
jgi:hypothetical protein